MTKQNAFTYEELLKCSRGELFGPGNAQLPAPNMLMMDRIVHISDTGGKYGKSVAQVALRWLIQRGVIIIPKSTHIERMRQNIDIFDFSLSDEDMAVIATLDTGRSLFFDHHDAETTRMFMGWK